MNANMRDDELISVLEVIQFGEFPVYQRFEAILSRVVNDLYLVNVNFHRAAFLEVLLFRRHETRNISPRFESFL